MSLFDDITNYLPPHPQKAQMALGLDEAGPDLSVALQLLEINKDGTRQPNEAERPEAVLVVRTGVKSCQSAVLGLTENGFNRLQAIYPPEAKKT